MQQRSLLARSLLHRSLEVEGLMSVEQIRQRHPLPQVTHGEHGWIGKDRPPQHQVEVRRDPLDLCFAQ